MKGGRGIDSTNIKPFAPIHYKIQKGGKRLRKTMKLFHKTLPKMKFSHLRKTHATNQKAKQNVHNIPNYQTTKKNQEKENKWTKFVHLR